MRILQLPVLRDNYVYLLHDPDTATAAVVDPAVAEPVLEKLAELQADLVAILNTHHHHDHVGGNQQLLARYPQAEVYASRVDRGRIPGQTIELAAGQTVQFNCHRAQVLFVPGHTRGHIAYYFPESGDLFCGDTLFAGGCGRLFEGTPQQMLGSLEQLRQLPKSTRVWCAHEYTLNNLKFALTVDRDNPDLQTRYRAVEALRQAGLPTVPSTLGEEQLTNPFLRWDQPALQAVAKTTVPEQVLARIRAMKDQF
ncbi:MAG: hydroxyacylglutathione hydrolase [Cyanobacteriota bacterium]